MLQKPDFLCQDSKNKKRFVFGSLLCILGVSVLVRINIGNINVNLPGSQESQPSVNGADFRNTLYVKSDDSLISENLNQICTQSKPVSLPYSFYRKGDTPLLFQGRMEFPGGNEPGVCNQGKFIDYNRQKGICQGTIVAVSQDNAGFGSELNVVKLTWNPNTDKSDANACSDQRGVQLERQ